eukprot:COSAG04_NODE_22634_length_351_cov_1.023810_1_plen_56_part_10
MLLTASPASALLLRQEVGYTREAFNRTVQAAIAGGEPCTTKPCVVTPWLSLGSGWK